MTSAPAAPAASDVQYISPVTGQRFAVDTPMWRDQGGSHLNLTLGHGLAPADIVGHERSLWRYASAIRVDAKSRISLGEGWTPLVARPWDGREVQVKLEYLAPTGSFKDRGTSVLFSHLRSVGLKHILEDSSGGRRRDESPHPCAGVRAGRQDFADDGDGR